MNQELSIEQRDNIQEVISRYRNWLTLNSWASGYWSNRDVWKREIENKVEELKKKLKQA